MKTYSIENEKQLKVIEYIRKDFLENINVAEDNLKLMGEYFLGELFLDAIESKEQLNIAIDKIISNDDMRFYKLVEKSESGKERNIAIALCREYVYSTNDPENLIEVELLAVDQTLQQQGYGFKMLDFIENHYRKTNNFNKISLNSVNTPFAHGLYYKLDYISVGRSANKVLYMEKPLDNNILHLAQITYEIYRGARNQKKTLDKFYKKNKKPANKFDFEGYLTDMIDNKKFDNLYQYGLADYKIKKIIFEDETMPLLLGCVEDTINKNIYLQNYYYNFHQYTKDKDWDPDCKLKAEQVMKWVANLEQDKQIHKKITEERKLETTRNKSSMGNV